MLKLKQNVVDFLMLKIDSHVVEEILRDLERLLSESTPTSNRWRSLAFSIKKEESKFDCEFTFEFSHDDFEEAQESEELEPYKWHPAESWDGNPNGYWILNFFTDWSLELYTENIDKLCDLTTHFMYIEPLELKND